MRSIIDTTVYEVLKITWPTLLIAVILVVTMRIGYLLKHRNEFVFYKEILYLCFMLYILCVFQLVTEKDLNSIDGNNLRLFSEIMRYDFDELTDYPSVPEVLDSTVIANIAVRLRPIMTDEYTESIIGAFINRYYVYSISENLKNKSKWVELFTRRLILNAEFFKKTLDKYNEVLDETKGYFYTKISALTNTNESDSTKGTEVSSTEQFNSTTTSEMESEGSTTDDTNNIDLPNRSTTGEYITSKVNKAGTSSNTDNGISNTRGANTIEGNTSDTIHQEGNGTENLNETRSGGVNVIDQRERMLKYIRNILYEFTDYFKDLVLHVYF